MKLLRARFENFRLLRDLELEFSTRSDKNLTVIRAENETGKTTILTAMQWAFFGDEALPGDAKSYRLGPIDWSARNCSIEVNVDFEVTITKRAGFAPEPRRYRVIRRAVETLDQTKWTRGDSVLEMYELTGAGGTKKENHPDNRLRIELPPELREIFFTDGDRALSFIEADSMTIKRKRVENAIKALLGLSVVEEAGKHVKAAGADINKQVKETNASERVRKASKRIEELDEEITGYEATIAKATDEQGRAEEYFEKLTRQIENALRAGNRSELVEELHNVQIQLKREKQQELSLARDLGELIKDQLLARQLLAGHIEKATVQLDKLREQGDIPNQAIPVLLERLKEGTCICGEPLSSHDNDAERRRKHIEDLVEQSRSADAAKMLITELYFGAKTLMEPLPTNGWKSRYIAHFDNRKGVAASIAQLNGREALIEAKMASIPDVDVQSLQTDRKTARRAADEQGDIASRARVKLERAKVEKSDAEEDRDKGLKEGQKGDRLRGELIVSQDLWTVFDRALARLKSDELQRVSGLMNDIFLEMIGADPDQGAIIRQAAISPAFDIIVLGPDDRALNPDRDLNGASRRALTLAFILALTKVSEVEAPNIIDTPLGMMSGYVKASVLRAAIQHSAQLVLFLTRSEIAGTESILKQYAGAVVTLTNPAHYPTMLMHPPVSNTRQIVKCDCSYDEECEICARRMDIAAETSEMEPA
jgi:DNA sulfur modification protein DndD